MNLTKEQKAKLAEDLSMPWGHAKLRCDGYEITLAVERSKGMTYRVTTYVNGSWKGIWFSGKEAHPEQKFLRKSVRPACPPAFKAKMEKILGKRAVAKDPYYNGMVTTYCVTWASGKAAISHLCKVCDSVEIIQEGI